MRVEGTLSQRDLAERGEREWGCACHQEVSKVTLAGPNIHIMENSITLQMEGTRNDNSPASLEAAMVRAICPLLRLRSL